MERRRTLVLSGREQYTGGITLKSPGELLAMKEAGRVVAATIDTLVHSVEPGMKTRRLDAIASREIRRLGASPAFKGYRGFPATICVSLNHEIVHGIPGDRLIREGDIVSIDVGAIVDGYYADAAVTVAVGTVLPEAQQLIETTRQSLEKGVQQAVAGNRVGDISSAVQKVAEARGYGVVREYVGHGIGRALHEEPSIPNFGEPRKGPLLRPGMVIAIEPMLNLGGWETRTLEDGWTVVTLDGKLSAHFEHTVAITEEGPQVLTSLNGLV